MGVIFYNGRPSTDFGIIVEKYPPINHGSKRGEAYTIPGRNGTFYTEDGTYDNYIQPYDVAIIEKNRGAAARCADIAAWLAVPGFLRLEDSFEPEYFKLARYAGPLNVEQIMGRYGRCTLEFECQPERWLKSGEIPIVTTSATVIGGRNLTPNTTKPLLKITRSSSTTVSQGNQTLFTIGGYDSDDKDVIIDCAEGTIMSGGGVDLYGSTTFATDYHVFPTLKPGDNVIWATNSTRIEIVPRWYVL